MHTKTKSTLLLTVLTIVLILFSTLVITISFNQRETNQAYADWSGEGSGTESDPYLIGTKAQLEAFRDLVNNGQYTACAKLTSNINLDGSSTNQWTPIGPTIDKAFLGVFDGNYHTISGLYIDVNVTEDVDTFVGLFGVIKNGAKIKNTIIEGQITTTNIAASNIFYAGGIVGYAHNSGSVCNVNYCKNNVTINSNHTSSYHGIGGIIGYNKNANVTSCANVANLTGPSIVGGIVGECNGIGLLTSYCYNTGNLTIEGACCGGIIGYAYDGDIEKCYNAGAISGASRIGGIAGSAEREESYDNTFYNCYNVGTINIPVNYNYQGGVTGRIDKRAFAYCFNYGEITGSLAGYTGTLSGGYDCNEEENNKPVTSCYALPQEPLYLIGENQGQASLVPGSSFTTLSVDQMKDASNFTDWDFNNVWEMKQGAYYPTLRNMPDFSKKYDLQIGNEDVTENNLSGEGWSFDPLTNKLTLNNYTYDGDGVSNEDCCTAIYYVGGEKLTIELKGTSNIKHNGPYVGPLSDGTNVGLYCNDDLEIIGDGQLSIDVDNRKTTINPDTSYGLHVSGDIVFSGTGLIGFAGGDALFISNGVYSGGTITINSGRVVAVGRNVDYYSSAGMYADTKVIVNGGELVAFGATSGSVSSGLYASLELNGGGVTASSGTADECYGVNADTVVVNGGSLTAVDDICVTNGAGISVSTSLTIGTGAEKVEATSEYQAIIGTINNAVKGYGWTDTAGTLNGQEIAINAGSAPTNLKKIEFPYNDPEPTPPGPGPEPTPTPPGPDPEPSQDSKIEDDASGVAVETSDGTAIPEDITLKVVVKTEISKVEGKVDPAKVQEKISSKEKVAKVYDVKLIRIVGELEQEIQPSDIKDGMKVKVEIQLPKDIKTKGLRILHVHGDGTIDEINEVFVENGVAIVEVANFSQFVLVTPAAHGFCIGWVAFILVMLELLAAIAYLLIRFNVLKIESLKNKLDLMTFICLCVAGAMFLFTLITLCVHQCAIAIVSFILAFLICGCFSFLFLEDKGITHLLPKKDEATDK